MEPRYGTIQEPPRGHITGTGSTVQYGRRCASRQRVPAAEPWPAQPSRKIPYLREGA